MDTNQTLRARVRRLIDLGIANKVIAGKMGMAPSTFSKWLNERKGINPPSVTALDGFNRFVDRLCSEAKFDPASMTETEQEKARAATMVRETVHAQELKKRATARRRRQKRSGKEIARK